LCRLKYITASIGKDGILLIDTMNVRRGGDKKLLVAIKKYQTNLGKNTLHLLLVLVVFYVLALY
jgi:hypothetical protein